jgi:cytochrome P450 family 110
MASPHNSSAPTLKLPPAASQVEAAQWESSPLAAIEEAGRQCGDIFTVYRRGKPARILVSDSHALTDVFIGHAADLEITGSTLFKALVGPSSLSHTNGSAHRLYRRIMTPPIHGLALRDRGARIQETVRQEIGEAVRTGPASLSSVAELISMFVVILYCFGDLPRSRIDRLRNAFFQAKREVEDRAEAPSIKALSEVIMDEIALARSSKQPDRSDLLGALLLGLDATNAPLPDSVIRDQLVTMLVAGQESTPTAITAAIYWVCKYPHIYESILAEVRGFGDTPDISQLMELHSLDVTVAEVLRLISVVPMGLTRRIATGFSSAGYDFPQGSEVVPCIHAAHRHADVYPNPEDFSPSRFVNRKFSGTEYLPYGIGERRCLGAALATFELKLAIANIIAYPGISIRLREDSEPPSPHIGPTVKAMDCVELSLEDR